MNFYFRVRFVKNLQDIVTFFSKTKSTLIQSKIYSKQASKRYKYHLKFTQQVLPSSNKYLHKSSE